MVVSLLAGIVALARREVVKEWLLSRLPLATLDSLSRSHPQDSRILHCLGRKRLADGQLPAAAAAFAEAFRLDENQLDSATQLGATLLKMRRYPEAFQILRMVAGRDSGRAEAHYWLGELYRQRESYDRAAEEFHAYLRLRPRNAEGWHRLGQCYSEIAQLANAEDALRRAISLDSHSASFKVTFALLLQRTGKLAEAEHHAREATTINPQLAGGWLALGEVLAQKPPLRQYAPEAERALRTALSLAPMFPPAHNALGSLLMSHSRWKESATELQAAVRAMPNYPEAHFRLAQVYRRLGDEEQARREQKTFRRLSEFHRELNELQTRIDADSQNALLRFRLGQLTAQHRQLADAIEAYRAGLDLEPSNLAARRALQRLEQQAAKSHPKGGTDHVP